MREEEVCMSRLVHRHPGVAAPLVLALATALAPAAAAAAGPASALHRGAAGITSGPLSADAPPDGKAGGMIDPDG